MSLADPIKGCPLVVSCDHCDVMVKGSLAPARIYVDFGDSLWWWLPQGRSVSPIDFIIMIPHVLCVLCFCRNAFCLEDLCYLESV